MKSLSDSITTLVVEDQGGEVVEYVLVAGLISVAALTIIALVGVKVLANWNTVNLSF